MTREERLAWFNHACTKELLEELNEALSDLKDNWSTGGYRDPLVNAEALGTSKCLVNVIDVIGEIRDVEH